MIRSMWRAVTVAVVLLLGAAALMLSPTDAAGYRDTTVKAAEAGQSAVRTVALLGRARLERRVFDPYVAVVLGDARQAVGTAQRALAEAEVPDRESAELRDELTPLLAESTAAIGDAGLALDRGDDAGLRTALARLDRVGAGLDSFVESHR